MRSILIVLLAAICNCKSSEDKDVSSLVAQITTVGGSLGFIEPLFEGMWDSPTLSSDGSYVYFGSSKLRTSDGVKMWSFTIGGQDLVVSRHTLSSDGSYVYFAEVGGDIPDLGILFSDLEYARTRNLHKVRTSDGVKVWSFNGSFGGNEAWLSSGALSPDGSYLYFSRTASTTPQGLAGALYKVRTSDGDGVEMWNFNGSLLTPALSSDGSYAYVFGVDSEEHKKLYKVRTSDGVEMWSFTLTGYVFSSTLSTDGSYIYFGTTWDEKWSEEGGYAQLYKLRTSDGVEMWSIPLKFDAFFSTPVLSSNGSYVYFLSPTHLYKMRTSDGVNMWYFNNVEKFPQGNFVNNPILSSDGSFVYFMSDIGKLYQVRTSDGVEMWSLKTWRPDIGVKVRVISSPALSSDGSYVYFGSFDYKLYKVRTSDGVEMWNVPAGGHANSSPTLSSDHKQYKLIA